MTGETKPFKLPKAYKPHNPIEFVRERPNELPEGLDPEARVKVILREYLDRESIEGGGTTRAGSFWWGDSQGNGGAIVGYRVINLKSPWVNWGADFSLEDIGRRFYDSPPILETNPDAEILVWLRHNRQPQPFIRPASRWHWELDRGANDIMKYRLAGAEDAEITRL